MARSGGFEPSTAWLQVMVVLQATDVAGFSERFKGYGCQSALKGIAARPSESRRKHKPGNR